MWEHIREFVYLCGVIQKAMQMKVSVYLKKCSPETSNICFRVREKSVDIKVVSPLEVQDRYWDSDTLSYRRTTAVPAAEQKRLPGQIAAITDDLMGVIFDKLTPFSANFIKLNDYSLRVYSLSALRVLYQRYASFYTKEEFDFMVHMIRTIYPPERYAAWLKE